MSLTRFLFAAHFCKNKQKSSSANISKTTPARKLILFCKRWRRKKSPKKENKKIVNFSMFPFLQHTVEWPSFNRRLLCVKSVIQSCCNSMCNFWRDWGGGQPAMASQTNANTSWVSAFRHFLLSAYHDWTPFVGFCKYPMETQYSTCTSIIVIIRGWVEDTRLEAKAKDRKKIRGQGQPFRGQTLSRPRTGMLEAKAKDQGHSCKCSRKKKGLQKSFPGNLQFKGVARIFDWGGLNHKSHAMTSSKICLLFT